MSFTANLFVILMIVLGCWIADHYTKVTNLEARRMMREGTYEEPRKRDYDAIGALLHEITKSNGKGPGPIVRAVDALTKVRTTGMGPIASLFDGLTRSRPKNR
jgi:hypothetical protein